MSGHRLAAVIVLHVVSGDLCAGAEAQVAALAAELTRDPQLQLHAVVLNGGALERQLRAAGAGVTVLDESQLSAWRILRGVRAVVRDFRPGVISVGGTKDGSPIRRVWTDESANHVTPPTMRRNFLHQRQPQPRRAHSSV